MEIKYFIKTIDSELCVCTNSVEPGDLVYQQTKKKIKTWVIDSYDLTSQAGSVFKKLGVVSPQAIWVKEGDEFDRNDFQCIWENQKGEQSLSKYDIMTDEDDCFIRIKFLNPHTNFYE